MRRVVKGEEPQSFSQWKARANENWIPTYGNLQNPEKRELHLALLQEQNFTCCYCGREIDSTGSHIEHFKPQSRFRQLDLAHENLFASCQRETYPGDPLVCGHLKDEQFDAATFLSPLEPDIEAHFSYTLFGDVIPQDDRATTMTSVLGLNNPFLTSRRGQALVAVFDEDFLDTASSAELTRISSEFRNPDQQGRLPPFFHVIARFAENLSKQAPPAGKARQASSGSTPAPPIPVNGRAAPSLAPRHQSWTIAPRALLNAIKQLWRWTSR